jgi:hypothetical protein
MSDDGLKAVGLGFEVNMHIFISIHELPRQTFQPQIPAINPEFDALSRCVDARQRRQTMTMRIFKIAAS